MIAFSLQAGITRMNIDESIDSGQSVSTCNSPMLYQKDVNQNGMYFLFIFFAFTLHSICLLLGWFSLDPEVITDML